MKNTFFTAFALLIMTTCFAQEAEKKEEIFGKNELKLNVGYLLGGIFEASYERNLNKHSSLGISYFSVYDEDLNADYNFMVNPYYRIFFGKKPAQGFFVEANAALASLSRYDYSNTYIYDPNNPYNYYNLNRKKIDEFGFGLGIAVGGKFVLNDQFVVDVYGGLGRFLNTDIFDAYPRLGINLGYRF